MELKGEGVTGEFEGFRPGRLGNISDLMNEVGCFLSSTLFLGVVWIPLFAA